MTEKQKGLYARKIVALCLLFCAVVIIATYIARWWDVDTVPVMTCCCGLYGGELLLLMVKRLMAKDEPRGSKISAKPGGMTGSKPPGRGNNRCEQTDVDEEESSNG